MNYSIIRCICALVIGVLLVAWPEAAILYLVITIGVLFLVPGLFSLSGYLIRGKQDGSRFPIAGLGSLLFGLWLMIMPAFFVGILMYVLGAVLVLAGISQIVNLSAARSWTVVPGGFFVIPVLVLIAGIVVLFNPFTAAAVPFIILGVSSIVYGLSDLINIIRFRMYVLGAVLVLAGISQIVNLSAARSWTVVPGGFFVIPVLVLIAGIVVLFNPFTAAAVPFIILGVSSIVYGLSDLINIIRFRQKKEPGMPEIEDITPIEEIKD